MNTKNCNWCEKIIHRKGECMRDWERKRFCNLRCAALYRENLVVQEKKKSKVEKLTDFWLYKYKPVGV